MQGFKESGDGAIVGGGEGVDASFVVVGHRGRVWEGERPVLGAISRAGW